MKKHVFGTSRAHSVRTALGALALALAGVGAAACTNAIDLPPAAPSSEAVIRAFKLTAPEEVKDIAGTVSVTAKRVSVIVPEGTDLSALRGKFTLSSGATVSPDSENTAQPYGDGPVTFAVNAQDGTTTTNWQVEISAFSESSKEITSFMLNGIYPGVIDQTARKVRVTVPYSAAITAATADVTHTGESITPPPDAARDWTNPINLTVKARDNSEQTYNVTVVKGAPVARRIVSFAIDGRQGAIDQANSTIKVTLPHGTAPGVHTPVVSIDGASYEPAGATDFSAMAVTPVIYTVKDAAGGESTYAVTVVQAEPTSKEITSFSLSGLEPAVLDMVKTTINKDSGAIALTIPYGMLKSPLTPVIGHTGMEIVSSPANATDFTGQVTYTVTAADGSTKAYTVSTTNAMPIPVTLNSVTGDSTTAGTATQVLTFEFSAPVTTMRPAFIALDSGEADTITAGTFAPKAVGSGVDYSMWEMAVSNISRNNLSVKVGQNGNPTGYMLTMNSQESVDVYRDGFGFMSLTAVTRDANPETPATLTFTFDADLPSGWITDALAPATWITGEPPVRTAAGTYTVKVYVPGALTVTAAPSVGGYAFAPASRDVEITKTSFVKTFDIPEGDIHEGTKQDWSAPYTGSYKIQIWGARGGKGGGGDEIGGWGGYTYGTIALARGDTLSFYIGKKGEGGGGLPNAVNNNGVGGWKGGGTGGLTYPEAEPRKRGGGGGGATDVRMGGQGLEHRILVAGGGGAGVAGSTRGGNGGGGPGTSGTSNGGTGERKANALPSYGGTQTSGYALGVGAPGTDGQNFGNSADGNGGGGGGYWGGTCSYTPGVSYAVTGGGGGSSYVHPDLFTDAGGTQGGNNNGHGRAEITMAGWEEAAN